MSATGRGRRRNPRDFYETPAWVTHALFQSEKLFHHLYEPACGTGAILRVLGQYGKASGSEISEASVAICKEGGLDAEVLDYLSETTPPFFGDVVMNPPYKHAAEFVRKALERSEDGMKVCALLRLNFLGSSRKRLDLVGPDSPLRRVHVLSKRPSFTGDGRTDAAEYAWFVFQKNYAGPSEVSVVPVF
jgi:hypothetical protein